MCLLVLDTRSAGFCVCEMVNSADNSIEEVREQTPKAASGYCFCKLKRPSLFSSFCKQYFFNKTPPVSTCS